MGKILALSLIIFFCPFSLYSQQNNTLFFMPNTPQVNFVNPAVTNDCKLIIGLPVLSSVHLNAGNSGFSFNQVLKKQGDSAFLFDGNSVMRHLHGVNYFDSELHSNLIFAGYRMNDNYLTFSINEKADIFATYPGDLFAIAWNGNTQFEGKTAKLGRSAVFLDYRREYAIGIARQANTDLWWGVRGKLLFGKLNITTSRSKIDLFTDPVTFDLDFNSDWQVNTSLPMDIIKTPRNTISSLSYDGSSAGEILFNRKNLGFSTDLGFIRKINKEVTVSGSILDLGFISWKDHGNAFRQKGEYFYSGPIGDSVDNENYIRNLARIIRDEFGITAGPHTYMNMLTPRIYLGATYLLRPGLTTGILGTARINRFKIPSGITLSLNKEFSPSFSASASYSYMYNSLKNLGLGLKAGRSPLQFYLVSDNVLGFIFPLSARNGNIRFGLQLSFGCEKNSGKEKFGGCGCEGMDNLAKHNSKLKSLVKKGNKHKGTKAR